MFLRPDMHNSAVRNASLASVAEGVRGFSWRKLFAVGIGVLLLVVVLKVTLDVMRDPSVFPVKEVIIDGEFVYLEKQDLVRIISSEVKRGFFNIDLDALTYSLEALPWVKAVALRRVWPETLMVDVVEQRAFAYWGENGLVNVNGEAFFPERLQLPSDLPQLSGPQDSAQEMTVFYRRLSDVFLQRDLRISKLSLDDRHAWDITLSNGLVLKLGRVKSLERIQRFLNVYSRVVGENVLAVEYVDLRYPNGFSIQWQGDLDVKTE